MLIFIHGFNSAGNSDKGSRLRSAFAPMTVLTPTCGFAPIDAVAMLSDQIAEGLKQGPVTLVGSSLGGFYAPCLAYRYKLPCVLINPLVDQRLLRYEIGPQRNYYTGETYEWTEEHCAQLDGMVVDPAAPGIRPLLLLDEGDELLDSHMAAAHFTGLAETHMFPGGSHRFEHLDQSLPLIRNYIDRYQA